MLTWILTVAAGGVLAAWWVSRQLTDGKACLRAALRVAHAHRGELIEGAENVWPMVCQIPHPGGAARGVLRLAYLRRWTHTGIALDTTRLELPWPGPASPVTYRIRLRASLLAPAGAAVSLGHSAFDTDYILESQAHEGAVRNAVPGPAREELIDVARIHRLEILLLSSGPTGLDMTVKGWAGNVSAAGCLIRACWKLCDAVVGPSEEGPFTETIHMLEMIQAATTSCHVCGAEVTDPQVRCTRCEQPYHRDCWNYVGVCSNFGCGSTACRPSP